MRRFTILDIGLATLLVAFHCAALHSQASNGGSNWAALLYLTPTLITCLLHLRLRLKISAAMAVHYLVTVAWTFLHSVGVNMAMNAFNLTRPVPGRQRLLFSNAWYDTLEMMSWGIAPAATYGLVCYVAVTTFADQQLLDFPSGIAEARDSTSAGDSQLELSGRNRI